MSWGTDNNIVQGADGTAIGTGNQNTLDIIVRDPSTSNGAHACNNYSVINNGTTYSDFFLPSRDELFGVYNHIKSRVYGSYTNGWDLSSSEFVNYQNTWNADGTYFWRVNLVDGQFSYSGPKLEGHEYVIPIRAFN